MTALLYGLAFSLLFIQEVQGANSDLDAVEGFYQTTLTHFLS